MSFEMDNEILQDFLIEAGEILEKLGEQLVDLEHRPTDKDLLNAVFRGFHTIKGGAGFLNITPLVEVCHRAEDVFNTLRQGQSTVDAELMDIVLKVTDDVNAMMDAVRAGQEPNPADPALLDRLRILAEPQRDSTTDDKRDSDGEERREVKGDAARDIEKDAVEQQFEELLETQRTSIASETSSSAESKTEAGEASDNITDDEFEALLDQLHGPGTHAGTPIKSPPAQEQEAKNAPANRATGKIGDTTVVSTASAPDAAISQKSTQKSQADGGVADAKKMSPAKEAVTLPQADTTVRVDTKRLDDIMNLVGELVLVRNRLDTLKSHTGNDEVTQTVSNLVVVTSDLQAAVMKTRMQPIKKVFGRFPRVVRDLSRLLKKEINLELVGEETDLDKNLVEAIADPLVHLVRNSIDHGIEVPEARQAAGKPRAGTITLSAKQEGDHILLTIKDDGAGMNADKLRRSAIEKGLLDTETASRLDERECYNLIFMPGFSTKTEISDISGRGVGMDVVKTRITQLNGNVEIDSQEGGGTEINIKLPLTLAIVPTLMVMLGSQIFAIPLASVSEIIQYESVRTNVVDGQSVAIVRDHPLPLFYLRNWLLRDVEEHNLSFESSYIVVIKIGPTQIACVVDQLIAQEEVVIKPLGALLHGLPGLAGATITGDGRIAIILDMPSLISRYARRFN